MIKEIGERAYFIPSGDHPHVMAGQGTISLELLEQVRTELLIGYTILVMHLSITSWWFTHTHDNRYLNWMQ